MSCLQDLIREYCPEGVPYRLLGEIGSFYGGLSGKSKDDFKDGNATFITYMNVYSNIELDIDVQDRVKVGEKEKQNTIQYGDVLFTGSSETPDECGMSSVMTKHSDEKLYLNSFCFGYRFDNPRMFFPGFTKHLFRSSELRNQIKKTASGVTRFNVSKKKMERVVVPVPPLEVQREIARILDNFTFLSAELSAELSARKKQYEYYRNRLLSFGNESIKMPLSEVANVFRGEYITQKASQKGNIPVILGGQEPAYYIDKANHEGEIVVVARSGASAGFVSYWNEPIFVTDGFGYEAKADKAIPKYLYYALKHKEPELNAMKRGAGVPHVSGELLGKVEIPVPDIAVQKRLVGVLDSFDAICADLNIGLPAEIEARQKQYEYYRDLLLTFAETGSTVLTDRQTDRQTDRLK